MKELLLMAGIAAAKARDFEKAERYLQEAVRLDTLDTRAQKLLRQVRTIIERRREARFVSAGVQLFLAALMLAHVVGAWLLLLSAKISATQFTALLPLLLGLLLVIFLLPRLTQLKLAGFEAKLELPEATPAESLLQFSPRELQPLFGMSLGLPGRDG